MNPFLSQFSSLNEVDNNGFYFTELIELNELWSICGVSGIW